MPEQTFSLEDFIRREANAAGLDPAIALAIAEKESSFNPTALGPEIVVNGQKVRAIGTFQLLPTTAARFGKDPNDPQQNVQAGVAYLKELLERHQDPYKALGEYGGVRTNQTYIPDALARIKKYQASEAARLGTGGTTPPTDPLAAASAAAAKMFAPLRADAPPSPDPMVRWGQTALRFGKEATAGINPVNIYQGIKQLVTTDPRETARGLFEAHAQPVREGYYEGAIPLLGPRLVEAHKFAEQGRYPEAAGAIVDVAGQVVGPKLLGRGGRVQVAPPPFRPRLNPQEAAAVAFGQARDVPIDVATASGSPFALKLQRAVESTPAGSPHAERAALARGEAMPRVGESVASRVSPTAVSPEQAGRGLQQGVERYITGRHQQANRAYDALRQIEADPIHTQQVQVGTKQVPVLNVQGRPMPGRMQTVPVMQTMQLPVDLRVVKRALRPLHDRLRRQLPVTQQEASPGLRALDNLVNGPDFAPATQVDIDLGTIKSLARGADLPALRDISQGVAAQGVRALSDAVDTAIARAGPQARQALDAGRAATRAKHAAAEVFKQLREEPVQAFGQAKYARDSGIDYLRELQRLAPQEMPKVGRAVLEDLFSTATAEGGWSRATGLAGQWQKLGPETKKILFGAAVPDLDKFFQLGKMLERTPNPSGTALTLTGVGSAWAAVRHPRTGLPSLLAAGAIAKRMHDPKWVRRLTEGLTIPAGSTRGVLWTTELLRALGEESEEGLEGAPPPPPTLPGRAGVGTPPPTPPKKTSADVHLTIR